ncbi:TlpA disulfide reductase family protein [Winogradskyella sp.]|uniref:TlpA family protein disulfide reductase n=1 Tax=Winogradskyella sp. TaxID=1883156 RepID=UPI001B0E8451|nr:TlpA disulfide reductase family protein [Winogradskyella sp.]MBO6881766.1 TlpA family protein disulfide reductase [Winogradskyella sp.]
MKRLFVICIAVSFFACKEDPKVDYAIISGKIDNPTAEVVNLFDGNEKIKEITLKEDGTFADTLKIESGYFTFVHNMESATMYLEPENDIKVSLDFKEFDETLTYTGKGSENNNYLATKYLLEENANLDVAKVFALEEAEFLATMDEVKSTKLELLKSAKNISDDLKALEKKNIDYEHFADLQRYKSYHAYYAKKEEFKPSEDFMKLLQSVDYNNEEDYAKLDSYKRLVQGHYASKISDSKNPSEVFEDINNNTFKALKNDLSNRLRYDIAPNNEHNEAYYNGLMAMSTDEKFKEGLTAKYDKVKKLAKGMPSPEFVEYENHKGGTTSLEDLKGKYVYVDVWATWCGPCIREIPSLKEVEKQFHGKNIAFVSTSIDKASAHNTWVEMVKEKELGGVQLMADNDWNSQFVKDYAIEGIPRFILIDPDGNIVSADAPRPSNPKLVKMFNELKI